jgi:apolipoprotein N-acyltransferase
MAALILSLVTSAFLMGLGLRSPEHLWLAWVALLPLFAAIRTLRPGRAMLCGALWGCCLYIFTAAAVGTGLREGVLSLALLTAIPAAYAFLGAALTRWIGFNPLVLGVAWMGVELTFEPLGLRHGLLAGTQGDGALIHWIGSALGYVLVAFVVALGNGVLLLLLSRVPVGVASPRCLPGSSASGTRLVPQTFSCFPLFAIPASQPRAPPVRPIPND